MSTYINAIQADAITKNREQASKQLSSIGFDLQRRVPNELTGDDRFKAAFRKIYHGVMRFK